MILATLIVGAIILLLLWKEVFYPLSGLAEDSHAFPSPAAENVVMPDN